MPSVEQFSTQLRKIVMARIEADKLPLPSMPEVATKCLELCNDPDMLLGDIGREIERDPLMSAHMLRLANSAALGGRAKTTSIQQCVTRLGMQKVKNLVLQVATRAIFQSRDKRILEAFNDLWKHSVAVAVVARDCSLFVDGVNADIAYQAGLLHDAGKPVVGVMLLEAEKVIRKDHNVDWFDASDWLSIVQELHRPIAVALARRWELAQEVTGAIEGCSDYDSGDRQSVSNVVRMANAITKQLGMYAGSFDEDEVGTQIMVGRSLIGVDEEMLERVTEGIEDRIGELLG